MSFLFRWASSSSNSKPSDPSGQQQQPQELQPPAPTAPTPPTPVQVPESQQETSIPRPSLPNNLKLLFGGFSFFMLSTLITRRSIYRRHFSTIPPFYTSSPYHQPQVSGPLEALEALNLATINVVSLAMVGAGATMYALDVNTLDDMRRYARRGLGFDSPGTGTGTRKEDEELGEELEQWLSSVLGMKEVKEIKERARRKQEEDGDGKKLVNDNGKER
ncbi:hypothetical protein VTN00DRAFT_7180 [Thermoascus crustaceus]|uniref:uncharacterized protein n=1 Tax=Thermoascus crustaceus TaxID=5088 RepID=UPI003744AE0C